MQQPWVSIVDLMHQLKPSGLQAPGTKNTAFLPSLLAITPFVPASPPHRSHFTSDARPIFGAFRGHVVVLLVTPGAEV